MNLVTLLEANDHLRLDLATDGHSPEGYSTDVRTPEVTRKIEEATDIVLDYIQSYVVREAPEWDEDSVPPRIRAAILLVLGWLWADRGDVDTTLAPADGYLTKPVTSLLHRYVDPALA